MCTILKKKIQKFPPQKGPMKMFGDRKNVSPGPTVALDGLAHRPPFLLPWCLGFRHSNPSKHSFLSEDYYTTPRDKSKRDTKHMPHTHYWNIPVKSI